MLEGTKCEDMIRVQTKKLGLGATYPCGAGMRPKSEKFAKCIGLEG